jgi:hypothetical protein
MWLAAFLSLATSHEEEAVWRLETPLIDLGWTEIDGQRCTRFFLDAYSSRDPVVRDAACLNKCPDQWDSCDGYAPDPLALCVGLEECKALCRRDPACDSLDSYKAGRCYLHTRECAVGGTLYLEPVRNAGFFAQDDRPSVPECPLGKGIIVTPAEIYPQGYAANTGLPYWDRYTSEGLYKLINSVGSTYYQIEGIAVLAPSKFGCGYVLQLESGSPQLKAAKEPDPDEPYLHAFEDPARQGYTWEERHQAHWE